MEPSWVHTLAILIAAWAFLYLLWRMLMPEPVQPPYDWSQDQEFLASLHEYTGRYR